MSKLISENQGFWLNKEGFLDFRKLDMPRSPREGEVLVKVLYSGVNPADIKHVSLGVYDTVAGYDFCGEVILAGRNSEFSLGDVIAGATPTGMNRPVEYGSHQNYLLYPADGKAFKVPVNMPYFAAACIGVVARTAADAFFNLLRYPLIGEDAKNPAGILLIWGGTTSIGISILQYARARRVSTIFVVAPPEQFELLQSMGANDCFDFMAEDVVDQIRKRANEVGQLILNVIDAVGSLTAKTADTAAACGEANANVITLTVHPHYKMPFCTMYTDTELNIDGVGHVVIPKREEDAERASQAFNWAVDHYGNGFEFPRITITSGLSPISIKVASGVSGCVDFGKNVISHPIYAEH